MRAKKSLGQNFIHDENFLIKLNKLISSNSETSIIEIGSGTGALTKHLIRKKYKKIILIEKDSNLLKYLQQYKNKKISILNRDALNFDLHDLNISKNSIIVGNLPFNISSQLLIKWTKFINWPPFYQKMYLMFQKELGERIVAKENSKSYGRISVITQSRFNIKRLLIAPAGIFFPKPKVDGIVLEFSPIKKYKDIEIRKLETILRKAFLHRRKKIRTSLKDYKNILELNNFNLDLRAENLTIDDFCKLSSLI
tara:strand:- start:5076 stop:5834 length:759 start_codon:yes stop_codon:yes gene_type:complete